MASLKVTIRSLKVRPWGTPIQFLGSPKDVKTGLLTSLAKYESRMSSLELAHQCLMVWNNLIEFRKLDMSRYMQDTSCLLQKNDSSVWFRAPDVGGTTVPGLLQLFSKYATNWRTWAWTAWTCWRWASSTGCPSPLHCEARPWGTTHGGPPGAPLRVPPAIFVRFAGGGQGV